MSINLENEIISDMGILSDVAYEEYGGLSRIYIGAEISSDKEGAHTLSPSYTVIDYIDTPVTDMQALLLKKTGAEEYVIAFRGTQEFADKLVDATIGFANFNPQFSAAKDFVQAALDMDDSVHNITTENLTLTGHSLGGILTQSVGAVMGIKGYAFNPYGTERLLTGWPNFRPSLVGALTQVGLYKILDGLGLSSSYAAFAEENILNISYNDFGTVDGDPLSNLATTLTSDHLGSYLPLFGEEISAGDGHRMPFLNAAISHYNDILKHFSDNTTFADLSAVYTYGALGDIDGYTRVEAMFDELGVANAAAGSLSFDLSFSENFPANFVTLAKNNDAYLYALVNLNPYTITGNGADYSFLDNDAFSDQYLTDRQTFLFQTLHPETPSLTGEDIDFYDKATGIEAFADGGVELGFNTKYSWGDEGNNTIIASVGDNDDHLYESSPKAFSPQRAVFELDLAA
jgi:hypothetical protein